MATIKTLSNEQYLKAVRSKRMVSALESEEYETIKALNVGEAIEVTCDSETEFRKIINRYTTIKRHLTKENITLRVIQDSSENIIFVKREA